MQRAGLVSCKCQTEDDGEVRINSWKQTWKLNIVPQNKYLSCIHTLRAYGPNWGSMHATVPLFTSCPIPSMVFNISR